MRPALASAMERKVLSSRIHGYWHCRQGWRSGQTLSRPSAWLLYAAPDRGNHDLHLHPLCYRSCRHGARLVDGAGAFPRDVAASAGALHRMDTAGGNARASERPGLAWPRGDCRRLYDVPAREARVGVLSDADLLCHPVGGPDLDVLGPPPAADTHVSSAAAGHHGSPARDAV